MKRQRSMSSNATNIDTLLGTIKCDGPIGEYMQDLDWLLEAGDVYKKIEEIPQIKRKIS